jgi:hypothetical protein
MRVITRIAGGLLATTDMGVFECDLKGEGNGHLAR